MENNIAIEKVYPKYKYITLTLFSLITLMNAMQWSTFMPITNFTIQILNITTLHVYFLSVIFMISQPLVSFFSNYFLEKKGLRFGLHIGTGLTLAGVLIRCLGYYGYVPLIIGQTLASFGQPFILNATSKVVNEWFEIKKRPFFITLTGSMNNIGISIGYLVPSLFLRNNNVTKIRFLYLLIAEAAIVLVISIFQFTFFKASPHIQLNSNTKLFDCESYKKLFRNKNCVLEIISSSFLIANFCTFSTVLETLIAPFNFTSSNSSILGFILIFGGVGESLLFGILIAKTQKYKVIYLASTGLCLALFCVLYPVIYVHKFYLMVIMMVLMGPGMIYIIPLSLDFAQLLSPGIDESITCGLIASFAQVISIVQISLCDKVQKVFIGKTSSIYVICIMGVAYIVGLITAVFIVETFKKVNVASTPKSDATLDNTIESPEKVSASDSFSSPLKPSGS